MFQVQRPPHAGDATAADRSESTIDADPHSLLDARPGRCDDRGVALLTRRRSIDLLRTASAGCRALSR
ncbi:hypothetical protein CFP66_34315 [Pseudonocardia sp. MH-G8]|nr:hypothetical protein CFP66_34315 [Pseudonocardia sp. MH-G8]